MTQLARVDGGTWAAWTPIPDEVDPETWAEQIVALMPDVTVDIDPDPEEAEQAAPLLVDPPSPITDPYPPTEGAPA